VIDSKVNDPGLPQEQTVDVPFSVARMIELIASTGLLYSPTLIKRFAFSLMSKQFVILSGLAGSGKTQLALAFASALIKDESQMCVVPVGADWTNREPLLGFPNALQPNEYVKPESGVLDLLIEANKPENAHKPYFLILDEMNMSYVERYFADFLSAMESHKAIPLWKGNNETTPQSVCLPKNLLIIGTINVDETTYMFSPKVLDRANVIEFKISDKEMEQFLNEMKPVDRDSINYKGADMGADFVNCVKDNQLADDSSIKDKLNCFFRDLKTVNAEFGYRSATEIYRFVSQAKTHDDTENKMSLEEIVDCAIVQKLMPKLHGSRKKLDTTLNALWKECFISEADKQTLPILKDNVVKASLSLTADKIQRMYDAAMANGFTSFSEA
jgi:5-methylcytosine-specific restriction protein B